MERKSKIIKKIIEHRSVVNYIPHYARLGKEAENNHAIMDAMKVAYA
jgi:hypothetical protein